MARPGARPRDPAAGPAGERKAKVEPSPATLTKAEHELPDGRYLLAYGYERPAAKHA